MEKALAHFSGKNQSTYSEAQKACVLYEKGFLAEHGYLWSMAKDQELRERLIIALNEIVNAYHLAKNNEKMISTLELIIRLIPFDEEYNYRLIKIYKSLGDTTAAFNHYQRLERLLNEEYDVEPSERIKALIKGSK